MPLLFESCFPNFLNLGVETVGESLAGRRKEAVNTGKNQKNKESQKAELSPKIMGSLETGRVSGRGQQAKQK